MHQTTDVEQVRMEVEYLAKQTGVSSEHTRPDQTPQLPRILEFLLHLLMAGSNYAISKAASATALSGTK